MAASGSPWYRMVFAPVEMLLAEVRSMFEVPRAMLGSILGTLIFCGVCVALVLWAPSSEAAEDEGPTLEFEPGALVRLGPKPEELPEKIIVEEKTNFIAVTTGKHFWGYIVMHCIINFLIRWPNFFQIYWFAIFIVS